MQENEVAVTQDDRIAAADVFGSTDWSRTQFLTGKRDKDKKVLSFARHRQQAEDTMRKKAADMLRKAIKDGYPTPVDKTTQCEHGQFGLDDCIACYDEQLLNTETAIRAATLSKEGE